MKPEVMSPVVKRKSDVICFTVFLAVWSFVMGYHFAGYLLEPHPSVPITDRVVRRCISTLHLAKYAREADRNYVIVDEQERSR